MRRSLRGADTYTGTTTVSAGVLQIGSGGTTGSLSDSSPVSVGSGAALAFNRSDNLTYGGTVSGAGGLAKLGNGMLTLGAANSFSGGMTVSSGTIRAGNGQALGTGAFALNAGGLDLNGNTVSIGGCRARPRRACIRAWPGRRSSSPPPRATRPSPA